MPQPSFETVQELELNAWPDLVSMHRNGWRIRLSEGFTGRANSVTALVRGAYLSPSDLDGIERIYASRGLPTLFRITELVADEFDAILEARGYRLLNPSEFWSVRLDGRSTGDALVHIADRPSPEWIADFGRLNGRSDFRAETMALMADKIVLPAGFAALTEDGAVRAIGMFVIDRGLMEVQAIAVDAAVRGRGLGRRLVSSLLARGRDLGAETAILSVAATNAPALRLYAGLGFEKFGAYHYRVKALQDQR